MGSMGWWPQIKLARHTNSQKGYLEILGHIAVLVVFWSRF